MFVVFFPHFEFKISSVQQEKALLSFLFFLIWGLNHCSQRMQLRVVLLCSSPLWMLAICWSRMGLITVTLTSSRMSAENKWFLCGYDASGGGCQCQASLSDTAYIYWKCSTCSWWGEIPENTVDKSILSGARQSWTHSISSTVIFSSLISVFHSSFLPLQVDLEYLETVLSYISLIKSLVTGASWEVQRWRTSPGALWIWEGCRGWVSHYPTRESG
jgi:hypothetical protein